MLTLDWWLGLVCNCIDLLLVLIGGVFWVGGLWCVSVVCWWMLAFWWFGWIVVDCFLAVWCGLLWVARFLGLVVWVGGCMFLIGLGFA